MPRLQSAKADFAPLLPRIHSPVFANLVSDPNRSEIRSNPNQILLDPNRRRPRVEDARIEALRKMAEARPDDPRPRFGLALEYEKAGRWEDAVRELREYLARATDEGNAYGRLGVALRHLGREDEAKDAYRQGIDAAYRHGHPTMAGEFEQVLEDWEFA
jgi:predicted Zn-dependent protease